MKSACKYSPMTIIFLTSLCFASPSSAVARQGSVQIPSKAEMKVLLKTAKTPCEHLRIAVYYLREVQRLTDRSKRDAELAARYEKEPPYLALEAGKGIAFSQGITHYGRWASLERKAAERAKKLAALYEQMARGAEAGRRVACGTYDKGERES